MQIFKLTATAAAVLVLCSYSLSSWGADSATAISSKKRANSVALQPQVSSDQPNKQLTGQSIPPSKAPTGTHPAISEGLQTLPPVPAAPIKQPPASVRTLPEIQQGAPSQGIRTRPSAVPPKGAPTNSARNSGSQAPGNPRIAAPGGFQSPISVGTSPTTPNPGRDQNNNASGRSDMRPGATDLPAAPAPQQNGGTDNAAGRGGFAQPSRAHDGTRTYTLSNGQQVPATSPDGSPATLHRDGSVSYNDGTSVSANGDGATVTTTPDGSQHTSTPRTIGTGFATPATTVDGESVYVLSNGEHVAAGDGVRVNRDGSLTGSDGTHIFVDPTTNETVVLNPDGTERSRERRPSERQSTESGSSQSGSTDNDDNDDDDEDNEDGKSDNGDDGDDGDDGENSEDGENKDDADDEGDSDAANSGVGLSHAGSQPESKTAADDFVAKKKGEKREPEDTTPPTCDENGSAPPRTAGEPQPGENGNCVPAGLLPSEADEEEEQPDDNGFSTPSIDDLRRSSGRGGVNIDPTGVEDNMRGEGPSFEEKLEDIGNTVNPGR